MGPPSDQSAINRLWAGLGLVVIAGLALALGYWRMFSHFPGYDDEGYIMLTVRDYLAGGDLYGGVYSQYGPAFYVLMDLLAGWFGMAITHAGARWFSLALWIGAAVGSGELVRYLARSPGWAIGAGAATFMFLYQFSEEAFHPGVVVVFGLPWLLRFLVARTEPDAGRSLALIAGAAVALLTLLKINVGGLFGVAFVMWYLLVGRSQLPGGRWGAPMGLGVLAILTLLAGAISESWVLIFALVSVAGSAGVVAVTRVTREVRWSEVGWGVLTGAGATLVVVGITMGRGTSFAALMEGVFWGPLRHADSYSFAVDWRPGTVVNALVAVAVLVVFLKWRRVGQIDRANQLLVIVRCGLLAGTALIVAGLDSWRVFGTMFSYIAPWIWVWIPVLEYDGRVSDRQRLGRPLVGMVLLWQMLHAYPVGGIQVCWGSFLWLSLVALTGPETLRGLASFAVVGSSAARPGGAGLGLLVAVKLGFMMWDHRREHHALTPVDLPGAGALRLPVPQTAAIRTLTINSILHGDVLFSLPGMFSFNLWSDVPTPTRRNTTLWYRLLDEADQGEIVASLEAASNPVFIVDWQLLQITAAQGMPVSGPLYDHIMAEYQPAFMANQFGFMVRRGRAIAPFGTAWSAPDSTKVQVCLLGGESAIDGYRYLDADGTVVSPWMSGAHGAVAVQTVDRAGQPQGAPITAWPLQWQGLAWVTIDVVADPADWSLIEFSHADGSAPTVAVRSGQ